MTWDWSTAFAVAGLGRPSTGEDGRDEARAIVQLVDEDTGAVAFASVGDVRRRHRPRGARPAARAQRAGRGSWEQTRRPEGLRWFRPVDLELPRFPVDDKGLSRLTVGRSMLFLHDVLGYTELDFEALDRSVHHALTDRYEGRLLGYDHHTLGRRPGAQRPGPRRRRCRAPPGRSRWTSSRSAVAASSPVTSSIAPVA